MRKNINTVHIEGYVYDISKISLKETGPQSAHPGTEYIGGVLDVAVDELGVNIIPVHFTYVTETYSKSGKKNNTFTALLRILNQPTWLSDGKDAATRVVIDGNIGLNDFIAQDGSRVSAKRCEGSFVTIKKDREPLAPEKERNTFQVDMVITKVNRVEADPDRHIDEDYATLGGAAFDFRNRLLPLDLIIKNEKGINYFEDLGASPATPVYTKIWGRIDNQTIKVERSEESAFGEAIVTTFERKNRQWVVTGTAKVPYEFGEEEDSDLTPDELNAAIQEREILWADIKKRNDDYLASRNNVPKPEAPAINKGSFDF